MGPAAIASGLMSPVHAMFGLHIIRRGLIFIDLAVAQIAALGVAVAIALGHEATSPAAYQFAVGFALAGALLISLTRFRLGRVPHESIIGVFYVFATAASIIVLETAPSGHGLEELKGMLAGNIIFVEQGDLVRTAWTYGAILAVLLALWKPITRVTLSKGEQEASKGRTILMDFAFYGLLGFVVASSVKVAGVLVVFAWLVMPAIVAFFFVENILAAAAIAIPFGMIGSLVGLFLSYFGQAIHLAAQHEHQDDIVSAGSQGWPTGPAIVVAMGTAVFAAYLVKIFLRDKKPALET